MSGHDVLSLREEECTGSDLKRDETIQTSQESKERETLAIIFHELRNPLNGILGNARIMQSSLDSLLSSIGAHREDSDMQCDVSVLDQELRRFKKKLKVIERCGKDQLTILNHVLDFNKLAQAEVTLESKPFTLLRDIFQPLIDTYSAISEEKQITFITALPETDLRLVGDAYRLKQVLTNLLSNAIKFALPMGETLARLELSLFLPTAADRQQPLHIQIKNTGEGLSTLQIAQLFKPYMQSDPSITRRFGGTGLGLVVCKQLLGLMHGEIVCTSSVSKRWVQFDIRLTLPLAPHLSRRQPKSLDGKTKKPAALKIRPHLNAIVLVVEDNKINQTVLTQMLKKFCDAVEVADNGQQAVRLYQQRVYSLIIMDIQMPEMDGLEATRAIRVLESSTRGSLLEPIPIVGLSADAGREQRETALKAGMNDYLTKPIFEKALYEKVARYARQTPGVSRLPAVTGSQRFSFPGDEQKSERLSPALSRGKSISSLSPALFARRLTSEEKTRSDSRHSQSRDSSPSVLLSAMSPDILDEWSPLPPPSAHAKKLPIFTENQEMSLLKARVTELERILHSIQMTTPRRQSQETIRQEGALDTESDASSHSATSQTDLLSSTQTLISSPDVAELNLTGLPPPIPRFTQRLAETKEHSVERARVLLQAIDYYFRKALAEEPLPFMRLSVMVSVSPREALKIWVQRLEAFYPVVPMRPRRLLIAGMALGYWQSWYDQVAQKNRQSTVAHTLLFLAESHIATWKERVADLEQTLQATSTLSTRSCLLL